MVVVHRRVSTKLDHLNVDAKMDTPFMLIRRRAEVCNWIPISLKSPLCITELFSFLSKLENKEARRISSSLDKNAINLGMLFYF